MIARMRAGQCSAGWTGTFIFALAMAGCSHGADAESATIDPVVTASGEVAAQPQTVDEPSAEPADSYDYDEATLAEAEVPAELAVATERARPTRTQARREQVRAPSPMSAPMPDRPRPAHRPRTVTSASAGSGAASAPAAAPPLARNGVLQNDFVGGHGVNARLSDLLDRGVMVDGQNVRLSAFQDRERLPYPVPAGEAVALYAETERAKVSSTGDTVHMQIALMARQGEAPRRPRMDIRLVLDRSGSMAQEGKWDNAIRAAHALVDRLQPSDTFGLISYAETGSVDLEPTRVGNRQAAHRAIDRLHSGGGTNIGDGLQLAKLHAPRRNNPTDVGMVVLISDGQATNGITDPRTLGSFAREMFDDSGVLTTSIGLGTNFDENTMLTIAREGSGSYHFVRRPADIDEILADELEARAQAVAQALRLRIVLGPGVVARRVYGSRMLSEEEHTAVRRTEVATDTRIARELGITRTRQREEEEGLRIHLPTFRRGDQHVVLLELDVPPGRSGTMAGIARVHLDYKDLVSQRNGESSVTVLGERSSDAERVIASVRRPVKRSVLAFQAGEALQLAARSLENGDPTAARNQLAERRQVLEAAADLWRDDTLRQDAALLSRYERVVASAYPRFGHDEQRTLVMAMNYFGDQRMQ